jgi:integrase
MTKQGYKETTIKSYAYALKNLIQHHADLRDPDSVKDALAKQQVSNTRKKVAVQAYTLYLKQNGGTWDLPIYKITRKIPFIPTEQELDNLIAGCGKKTSIFLQLLKETAMRLMEACNLEWHDVDLQRKIITLNNPSKHGNPRIFTVSNKLVHMLQTLSKINNYVLGTNNKYTRQSVYYKQRRRLAHRLDNPRLLRIGFHTFRHWKATMLYHQTKDIVTVKEFLGHKHLDTTMLYIQLQKVLFRDTSDDFTVKTARTPEDVTPLLEVGYEYVCEKDELMFFRKRK